MQSQELLPEGQVLEDEILAETECGAIQPRRSRSSTIMARIVTERPPIARRQVLDCASARSFDEGQPAAIAVVIRMEP